MIFCPNIFGSNDKDEILCMNELNNAPRMDFNFKILYEDDTNNSQDKIIREGSQNEMIREGIVWMATLRN